MESIYLLIDELKTKENMVWIVYYVAIKKKNSVIYKNIVESGRHYANWSRAVTKK